MLLCASDFLLSPWSDFQHQKGPCETKHSPAWAMANMIPMWPQDSCFSPVVAGVGGLPFRWHDPCLPQWSLQIRNLELLNLWNSETSIFISNSLSSLSFLRILTTFDLAHYCPNKRTFLIFKTPKGKPFINLCKIESIRVKIVILSAAVSVFLLLHGGQGVSQFGTKKSITKSLWHILNLITFFGSLTLVPRVRPVSSWRMGWSPLPSTSSRKDRPRWPRP